eukprot:6184939-Pleurochrysis_carterae.AAC.2
MHMLSGVKSLNKDDEAQAVVLYDRVRHETSLTIDDICLFRSLCPFPSFSFGVRLTLCSFLDHSQLTICGVRARVHANGKSLTIDDISLGFANVNRVHMCVRMRARFEHETNTLPLGSHSRNMATRKGTWPDSDYNTFEKLLCRASPLQICAPRYIDVKDAWPTSRRWRSSAGG